MQSIAKDIKNYVMYHRSARKNFMSIADYNEMHGTNIPENRAVEAAFHKDLKYKRMVGTHPLKLPLYDLAKGLEVEEEVEEATEAMQEVSLSEKCAVESSSDEEEEVPKPVEMKPKRRMARRKRFGSRISMKPPAAKEAPQQMKMDAEEAEVKPAFMKPKRAVATTQERKPAPPLKAQAFDVEDVVAFYQNVSPEFLEENEGKMHDVVAQWNAAGDPEAVKGMLRKKYGVAPGDSLKAPAKAAPTRSTSPWTAENVEAFYKEHAPEKLAERTAVEIASDWNECEVRDVISACLEAYGAQPEINTNYNVNETSVEMYRRMLRESGASFDCLQVVHFVPADKNFKPDFSSHAVKITKNVARALGEYSTGPYKALDGTRSTFKSVSRKDVERMFETLARNKNGPFFVEVESN